MRASVLLIFFLLSAGTGWSQPTEIVKDLRDLWKVSAANRLEEYTGQEVSTIHIVVTDRFKGGTIVIHAPQEFTLFVNGQLRFHACEQYGLNVDSLLSVEMGSPLLSIFMKGNMAALQINHVYRAYLSNENTARQSTFFKDFVILGSLLLFGFFVILFRTNTRLTVDYLNVVKVFSLQEREEAIVTSRIRSSVNILFFVFISMLGSFLLIIIFKSGPAVLHLSNNFSIQSMRGALIQWLILSVGMFILLIGKLLLIWSMSTLFDYRGVVRFQFFNFIRTLFVVSVLMGLFLVIYYMLEMENPDFFYFLLASACGILTLNTFFLYFKLMTRTTSAVFHLFSYLCGSEIIPLMILIKVLLY